VFRRYIQRLGPYQSLALLAIPTGIVEPLKIVAVAIAGAGHWIAGTITIACAYATSLFLIERLFKIVKPKVLTLPWFARGWNWFVVRRNRVVGWLKLKWSPEAFDPLRCKVHPVIDFSPYSERPNAFGRD
jgi:hypothetical protein